MLKREISMLYVGDSSVIAYLHQHNYRKIGVKTFFSSDLSEALRLLREKKLDVIVVNINSLVLDAGEFISYVKDKSTQKSTPIVATGIPSSQKAKEFFLAKGANLFIEQPLPLSVFAEEIFSLLGDRVRSSERLESFQIGSVFFYEDKTLIEGEVINLSENGLLFRSPLELENSKGEFKLRFPINKKNISVFGEIFPSEKKLFYRLKFLEISHADKEHVRKLISSHSDKELAAIFYK